MLLLKEIHMNSFFQLIKSNNKPIWKNRFATTKLIVKIYNFKTNSSLVGLFPFPSRSKSIKVTRPLAKTTAQQVKPLTHKKSKIQNVKEMQQCQRRKKHLERKKF